VRNQSHADPSQSQPLDTEGLAEILHIKPGSIRSALCRDGHYLGLVPIKLPNRRLLWPRAAVQALLGQGVNKAA
jgi:hypothetical protein